MSDVVVLINDEELVLDKAGDIVGTYAINKLGDIASRQGNFTNTFNVPVSSAKNKEIAESAQQINSQTEIPYARQTAEIRVGGAQTVLGLAQLKSAKDFFQWVIKSGNADLFERIKGLSLRDLNLSAYDHVWNGTVVYNSRVHTYSDGYIYPDIDYGTLTNETSTISFAKLYAAVFDYVILQAIVNEAGFTISGDFLTNTLFRKKITPFVGKELLHDLDWVALKSFRAEMSTHTFVAPLNEIWYIGFNNDSTGGYFDNDNQFTLGAWQAISPLSFFTNNETGDYYFEANITFTITAWSNTLSNLLIFIYGLDGGNNSYIHSDSLGVGTFTIKLYGTVTNLAALSTMNIEVDINLVNMTFDSGEFSNIPEQTMYPLSTWNISQNLPDIKQSDFLLTLANEFGLFFQTNNLTNNINVFQFSNVINNIPSAKDWRQKVDLSERPLKQYLFEDYAQENIFTYATDEDDIYLSADPLYGQGTINVSNEFLQIKKDLFKSVFAPVKRISSFANTVTIAFIPKWTIGEDSGSFENTINAVPRTAYVDITNTSNLIQITGQPTRTTSPAVYFTDLEFENLIDAYYEPLERLLNKAKVVTALVRLTVADINQLDFEYPILFTVDGEDGYFYINEVRQFKFNTKESTEVELVLLRP